MNKFFRYLAFAFVAVFMFGLTSCGKDNDPQAGDIIGSWQIVKINGIETEGNSVESFMQFRTDGTVLIVHGWEKDGKLDRDLEEQTYKRKANKLYIELKDSIEEAVIVKLTEKELSFTGKNGKRIDLVRVRDAKVNRYL